MLTQWKHILCIALALMFCGQVSAQTDRQHVRKGNMLFRKGDFSNAALEYQKALSKNENNTQAIYNLGCAALQMGNDSLAVEQFKAAGKAEPNKIRRAMSFHNIGVVFQAHQQYGEAIEAYKEALRNNPADNETRYNLVLCKRQQQQDQQDQNQNNNQNQDNNQDKNKNNDKNKDNKDQKDKQNQNQDKQDQNQDKDQDQDQKQQKQPRQQMSQENAERLLDAAVQEEKRTQDKLKKAMQQPRKRMLQKNW